MCLCFSVSLSVCVEVATVNEISHIIQSSISFFFRNRLSGKKGRTENIFF